MTFKEIAASLKVKTPIARTYLSTLRCGGCPVQEREEEGRGRVFYLIKVDRRRKQPSEGQEPTLRPALLLQHYFDHLGLPWTATGVQDYAIAAFAVAYQNPALAKAIEAHLPKR